MVLRTIESGCDGELERMRSRETGAQELVHAFEVGCQQLFRAGGDTPANAPSRNEVGFRQAVKSDAGKVGRERRNGVMLRVVVDYELIVNFVGEEDQIVPA